MGREFELKFAATPAQQAAIAAEYAPFRQIRMETTYFDTPNADLTARHITLRRRMENERSVCTVKTPLPDGSRGEWELEWADPYTMVDALCSAGAPEFLRELTAGGIVPVCGARFTRLARDVELPGGTAELALDSGVLLGGGREIPLCEVEVELKSGSDEATQTLADTISAQFGLLPQPKSKFRRAKALADGE